VAAAIQTSGKWIQAGMPDTPLRSLIVDGVWSGVGSVIVFLPQILLLFLFIGVLEDSGYLARAALIALQRRLLLLQRPLQFSGLFL